MIRSESTVQYSLFTLRRRGGVTLNSDLAAIALLCKHLSRHGQISVSVLFFIICKLPNISKADVRRSVHRHKSTEIYFSRRCARAYELHVKLTICISTATTNSRQLFFQILSVHSAHSHECMHAFTHACTRKHAFSFLCAAPAAVRL